MYIFKYVSIPTDLHDINRTLRGKEHSGSSCKVLSSWSCSTISCVPKQITFLFHFFCDLNIGSAAQRVIYLILKIFFFLSTLRIVANTSHFLRRSSHFMLDLNERYWKYGAHLSIAQLTALPPATTAKIILEVF